MNVQQIVMIGNVEQFANVTQIAASEEFVTVTVHNMIEGDRVYSRRISAWHASEIVRHVEEVAALVSTGALVMWLLDCGFSLN